MLRVRVLQLHTILLIIPRLLMRHLVLLRLRLVRVTVRLLLIIQRQVMPQVIVQPPRITLLLHLVQVKPLLRLTQLHMLQAIALAKLQALVEPQVLAELLAPAEQQTPLFTNV